MKLFEHQDKAVSQALPTLQMYKVVYLVMEVRTGKTLTSLTVADMYLKSEVYRTQQSPIVGFVTKKKAIPSIEADFKASGLTYKLIVTNYEAIHKIDTHVDLWILDEAHGLGQFPKPSKRTSEIKDLISGAPCILLSGTPTPESPSQWYHQFWVTGNSPWQHKKFYDWAKDGNVNIRQKTIGSFKVNDYSKANQDKINSEISHLIVSCSQADAGFENEVEEVFVDVAMNDITKFFYKKIEKDQVLEYSGRSFLADTPANMINKFSQIAGGTMIDDEGVPMIFDESKARYIKENYSGKRIAIYYRYKAEYKILSTFFPSHTVDWQAFENRTSDVFMSQIQSGREGISLRSADLIIMYNIDFSATSYWQVRARMQYKGREGACPIHWLFSDLGIESKVYQAVSKKKNFTVAYYKSKNGVKNSIKNKSQIGESRLAGSENSVMQPSWMAGSTSPQRRENNIYRGEISRQSSDGVTKVPTQRTKPSWL